MSNAIDDNVRGLGKLSGAVSELDRDFINIYKSSKQTFDGFKVATKSLEGSATATEKLSKSFGGLNTAVKGLGGALLKLADVSFKLGALAEIGEAGYEAFKKFNGVASSLDFSKAILGTDQLSKNFELLEQTSDNFFNRAKTGLSVFTGNETEEWSKNTVAAYAQVEKQAYRLSTVTVSGNERSIDAINRNIEAARKLQKSTNFSQSTSTVLNASYDIASAGFTSKKQNANVGKAAINLSEAGFGELSGSTNALVRVLRSFGDESDVASKRAAQLFETTKVGLTTLDQLTPEIGSLASQSKQLGIDFGETSSALATLTTKGLSTAEASTALTNFLGEVVKLSPEATQALSEFTDEAGKPIQINASTLKEGGIQKVIEQLKKATGGQLPQLQKIFSSSESQKAASLLIGAGTDTLKGNTERIKGASSDNLEAEAAGRGKTLEGAFTATFNKSQAQVEDLGKGLKENVIDELTNTNTVLGQFTQKSSEGFGSFVGTLSGLKTKISAVGGLLATAFTVVAPVAIINVLFKKLEGLGGLFKRFIKDGESFGDALKRNFLTAFDVIENKLVIFIDRVTKKLDEIPNKINNLPKETNIDQQGRQLDLFENQPVASGKSVAANTAKVEAETIANAKSRVPQGVRKSGVKIPTEALAGEAAVAESKAAKVIGRVKGVGSAAGGVAKQGLSLFGGAIGESIGLVSKFAGTLGVGIAALQIGAGWFDTIGKVIDKRTMPEIQELNEGLKELGDTNYKGLKDLINDLDITSSKIQETSKAAAIFTGVLGDLGGIVNATLGKATQNSIFQDTANQAQDILTKRINEAKAAGVGGRLDVRNDAERNVQRKADLGLTLAPEDLGTLDTAKKNREGDIEAKLAIQRQKIAKEQENGGFGKDRRVDQLKDELRVMEKQAEADKAALETQNRKVRIQDKLTQLSRIKTAVPLDIQISTQTKAKLNALVDDVKEQFKKAFSGNVIDEKAFDDLAPKLQAAFDNIQVNIAIDPKQAADALKDLESTPEFAKFIYSDPVTRAKYAATAGAVTDANLKQSQTKETRDLAPFSLAEQYGAGNNSVLGGQKQKAQLESIDAQQEAITAELAKQGIPLERQLELQNQLAALDSKRAQVNAEAQITKELGGRKQTLSLTQELLNVETARVNLFNEEDKFGSLAVSRAQAKLDAANKQLEVSKEQLAITNREDEIKKQAVVSNFQDKGKRIDQQLANLGKGLDLNKPAGESSEAELIAASNKAKTGQIDSNNSEAKKTIDAAEGARKDAIDTAKEDGETFSESEQKKIAEAIKAQNDDSNKKPLSLKDTQGQLFDKEGKLKDRDSIQAQIAAASATQNVGGISPFTKKDDVSGKARNALELLEQKKLDTAQSIDKANKDANKTKTGAVNQANAASKAAIQENADRAKGIKDAKGQQAQNGQAVKAAQAEVNFTKILNDVKTRFQNLNLIIEQASKQIDAEYAARERIIVKGEKLGESFTSLASTASGIFSSSTLGSSLNNIGVQSKNAPDRALFDLSKAAAKINSQVKISDGIASDAELALKKGKELGASPEQLKQLEATAKEARARANSTKGEAGRDLKFAGLQTAVDFINAKLQQFGAKLQEASDKLNKRADFFKSILDFRQRQINSAAENNKSINNFRSAGFGVFGKNNPFAEQLQRKAGFDNIEEDRKQKQATAVTDTQKELIDLTVQDKQLQFQEKGYENALQQTSILGDISKILQGRGDQITATGEGQSADQFVKQIPKLIQDNQKFTQDQRSLIGDKKDFAVKDLGLKQTGIDRDANAQLGQALGSDLQPGDTEYLQKYLKDYNRLSGVSNKLDYKQPSLQDKDFQAQLRTLNGTGIGGEDKGNASLQDVYNRQILSQQPNPYQGLQQPQKQQGNAPSALTINAPVTISMEGGAAPAGNATDMRQYVQGSINKATQTLSEQILQQVKSLY